MQQCHIEVGSHRGDDLVRINRDPVAVFPSVLASPDLNAGGGAEELQGGIGIPKLQRISRFARPAGPGSSPGSGRMTELESISDVMEAVSH